MSELLGITGAIGSGKTTLADFLCRMTQNHARYEISQIVTEVANRFNQLLEAELNFDTTNDDTELVNQILIWMPDIITEHLHVDTTWNHLAITSKDTHMRPELYTKLFEYIAQVRATPTIAERTITTENKDSYRPILQWLGGYFVAKISPTIWFDELFRRIEVHDSRCDLVVIGGVRYITDASVVKQHGGRVISIVRPGVMTQTDVTEAEHNDIEADITIKNNGTLSDLQKTVEDIWDDIAAGKPRKEYTAG